MKEQTLAFRPGEPIFIHTPLGLIEIRKIEGKPGEGYRKARFTLPQFMTAFIGDKDDLKKTEHVAIDGDGRLVPTFSLLAPLVNQDGELIGVTAPTSLRLDEGVEVKSETPQKELETVP